MATLALAPSSHVVRRPRAAALRLVRPAVTAALLSAVVCAVLAALARVDARVLLLLAPMLGGAAVRGAELATGAALRAVRASARQR